jgi:hypothetical protein
MSNSGRKMARQNRAPEQASSSALQVEDATVLLPEQRGGATQYTEQISIHKKHDAGTVAFRRHGEASSASGFGSQAECRHNLPHSFR